MGIEKDIMKKKSLIAKIYYKVSDKCYVRQCGASMHFAKLPFNCLGVYQYIYAICMLLIFGFAGLY